MREQEININIFAGPATGKSTISSGLFYEMKKQGYKVEFISEYAKDLTYGKDFVKLKDQLLVFANQFHRYVRLTNHGIDYLIHESPSLMSLCYFTETDLLKEREFKNLVLSIFRNTKTINIFLERNKENGYQSFGRNQTEDQAVQLDYKILKLLIDNNIDFYKIKSDENTVQKILDIIKEKEKNEKVI